MAGERDAMIFKHVSRARPCVNTTAGHRVQEMEATNPTGEGEVDVCSLASR